ncbi:glutamine amidotransferase domain protein [Mycobacterium xenopi 3993]|nr:glutamine amidotransferase domain protein [Mycobacterium xenopi 3993]
MTGTTFVAHVRYATTGAHDVLNTHPFVQDGRIFAHNGVLEGLDVLDDRLREVGTADLVLGQTDSERMFALITASIRARGGDVSAGLIDAMQWLAANVPIYAVNVLLSTATDVWPCVTRGARALPVGPPRICTGYGIPLAHQPNSRTLRALERRSVGGVRQRADG